MTQYKHAADIIAERKYSDDPELLQEVLEENKRVREYMSSDDIPPVYEGTPKSTLDIGSAELRHKIAKHDLIVACSWGDYKRAKQIIERFKKPYQARLVNSADKDGITALDYARMTENKKLEKYLLRHGATETNDGASDAGDSIDTIAK